MPVKRFFGYTLVAVGALMALLCGSCGLLVFGSSLIEGPLYQDFSPYLSLLAGGLPSLLGLAMMRGGMIILSFDKRPFTRILGGVVFFAVIITVFLSLLFSPRI